MDQNQNVPSSFGFKQENNFNKLNIYRLKIKMFVTESHVQKTFFQIFLLEKKLESFFNITAMTID